MKPAAILSLLLLLTLPTCASLPVADPELPPFPVSVPTERGMVPVTLVPNLQCNSAPAYGCYYYTSRSIAIDAGLSPLLRWRVLRHEIVHAAMDASGVKFDKPAEENFVAEAMAIQQTVEMLARWPR